MTTDEMRARLEALPPGGPRRKRLPQDQLDLLVEYMNKKPLTDMCRIFGVCKDTLYKIYREEMRRRKDAETRH